MLVPSNWLAHSPGTFSFLRAFKPTGRKRRFAKSESAWHRVESEELRLVQQELWDRVAARWREVVRAWPIRKCIKELPAPIAREDHHSGQQGDSSDA